MSLSSSLFSGISGLTTLGNSMTVIGDNIANINTVGFKSSRVTFQDVLSQTVATSSGSAQVGRGTSLADITSSFGQGSFESTESSTDLAIGGDGFFVVRDPNNTSEYYTRAGEFRLDKDGNFTNPEGYIVRGWALDSTTGEDTGSITDVVLQSFTSSPKETSLLTLAVNLDADVSSKVTSLSNEWDGTATTPLAAASYEYQSTLKAYDSLGSTHDISIYFDNKSSNLWEYIITCNPAEDKRAFATTAEVSTVKTVADTAGSLNSTYFSLSAPATNYYAWYDASAAEVSTVTTVADVAGSLDGTYFTLADNAGSVAVWFDNGNTGTAEPAHGADRSLEVNFADGATANAIATAIALVIDADGQFAAPAPGANIITVTDAAVGTRTNAAAGTSGFTMATTTEGIALSDPAVAGKTGIEIDITAGATAAAVATATQVAITALGDFTATVLTDTVTITNAATGAAARTADGSSTSATGFTITETRRGGLAADHGLQGLLGRGELTFDTSGNITAVDQWVTDATTGDITAQVDGTDTSTDGYFTFAPSFITGTPQTIEVDFGMSYVNSNWTKGTLATSQFASASNTAFQSADGYGAGDLQAVTVATDGAITGKYSNGEVIPLYRVGLAKFQNNQALFKVGGNLFEETRLSGNPITGKPGTSGLGGISPNSLEQSNVDIAEQFVKMITTQANSKIITVTDQMLAELINLKR